MASDLRSNIAKLASKWEPPQSEDDMEAFGVRVAQEALRAAWHTAKAERAGYRVTNAIDDLLASLASEGKGG